MNQITLYTTQGCHLCELAYLQLQQLDPEQFSLHLVEIALDEDLLMRYGTTIPVIEFPDQTTLAWPFEYRDIEARLKPSRI